VEPEQLIEARVEARLGERAEPARHAHVRVVVGEEGERGGMPGALGGQREAGLFLRLEAVARRGEAREQLAHELLAVPHLHAPVREAPPVAEPLDCELDVAVDRHAAQEVGVEGVERAVGGEGGGERRAAERDAAEAVEPRLEAVAGLALELEHLVERAPPRSLSSAHAGAAHRASVEACRRPSARS